MAFVDTIVALSSGRLPSGVAVVRISGLKTRFVLETILGNVPPPRVATLSTFKTGDGSALDRGLALFFPGPRSFTGEDAAEFHLHGGRAVVAALLTELSAMPDVRQAEAGEFTRRAFLNGKLDLVQTEALADLIAAETEAQRRFAVSNANGAQAQLYTAWRKRLIHARAMLEAELDFADEDDVPGSVSSQVWADVGHMTGEIREHMAGFRRAEMIRDGYDVAIVGAPNAGKSSLLNALVKRDVAIVTDEPGTTRDLIEVALDINGIKVRLTDTAGLREGAGQVEEIGIRRAMEKARAAALVLHVEDVVHPVPVDLSSIDIPVIRVGSKVDIAGQASGYDLAISATSGEGIDDLLQMIGKLASADVGDMDDVLPSRARHLELLGKTAQHIGRALEAVDEGLELRAEELRAAGDQLGRISGAVDVEDLLDVIFSEFCIGK